jgi:nucleoside-diphosphate-sugar epimerase
MKTILITGGAGFIGSHLCDKLIKKNKVICVDNFITGRKENIKHLLSNSNFQLIEKDINENFFIQENINEIYHLASLASPLAYSKHPIETMLVNSIGTKEMLELAKEKKAKFLLASTSEIYGQPLEHPQKETYYGNVNTVGLRSCYDESKRFAETLTFNYARKFKLNVKIARIFNTYGPRMLSDDGRVIPSFIVNALKNKPLIVFGSGIQTRSFCFIDDLIEGLIKLMNSNYSMPVNLGNPEEIKIIDLAKKILELTKSKSKIEFKEKDKDDPEKRMPDISLAKKILKWQPKTSLNEGLKKTIEFFKGVLNETS